MNNKRLFLINKEENIKVSIDSGMVVLGGSGSGKTTLFEDGIRDYFSGNEPHTNKVYYMKYNGKLDISHDNYKEISNENGFSELKKLLRQLKTEKEERLKMFHKEGCLNIEMYNKKMNTDLERIYLIIDNLSVIEMFLNEQDKEELYFILKFSRLIGISILFGLQDIDGYFEKKLVSHVGTKVAKRITTSNSALLLSKNIDTEKVSKLKLSEVAYLDFGADDWVYVENHI